MRFGEAAVEWCTLVKPTLPTSVGQHTAHHTANAKRCALHAAHDAYKTQYTVMVHCTATSGGGPNPKYGLRPRVGLKTQIRVQDPDPEKG